MSEETLDLRLKCPFTMVISGPSSCGKTQFTKRLLTQRRLKYDKLPGKVFWFYKAWQNVYDKMLELGIVDEFYQEMPTTQWIEENITSRNCTIVMDDMALDCTPDTAQIFSVSSHHKHLNVILLCQNLFTKPRGASNNAFREISLNSKYQVIFKNPRDKSSIVNFARQFEPGRGKDLAKMYAEATKKPYSYLFLDYHQLTPEKDRILSNIFFENGDPISKKNHHHGWKRQSQKEERTEKQ